MPPLNLRHIYGTISQVTTSRPAIVADSYQRVARTELANLEQARIVIQLVEETSRREHDGCSQNIAYRAELART